MQVGEVRKISIGGTWQDATVKNISTCEFGGKQSLLVIYDVPGYGETQPYLVDAGQKLYGDAENRMDRSLMPSQYLRKLSQDFDWTLYGESMDMQKNIANAFVSQYLEFEKAGRGLYIFSKTKGSGKTLLACVIANEIIRRKAYSMKFVNAADFVALIKSKSEEDAQCLESLYQCRLLIFDDIGTQDEKQSWINESLFRLIDYRNRERRPVIFTSNLDIDSIADERIADRISAMCVPLKMPEKKIRRQLADKQNKEFLKSIIGAEKERMQWAK
ncbi:MAG: ATP-binding protein [bacterium]|nr:ATP-binding protein [bacterium]